MRVPAAVSTLLLFALSSPAAAGTFSTSKAEVKSGADHCKNAKVEVKGDRLLVDCKKIGFAKKLTELSDVRWQKSGGKGTMSASDSSGEGFTITVAKKELDMLKAALVDNVGDK